MKAPCEDCPFRKDVRPYLSPERGMQLALLTRHRDGTFHCHKTVDYSVDGEPSTEHATICKGFALLRAQEAGNRFVKAEDSVYQTMGEMMMAYAKDGL